MKLQSRVGEIIFISTSSRLSILTSSRTDPDSPRLSKMIQGFYEEIEFPGHLDAFGRIGIYIRRGALL
jgi:hypothetical protein